MWLQISDQDRTELRRLIAEILEDRKIPWSPEGRDAGRQGRNKFYDGYYVPHGPKRGRRYHFMSLGKRQSKAYLAPTFSTAEQIKFTTWMRDEFPNPTGRVGPAEIFVGTRHPGLSFRTKRAHNGAQPLNPAIYIESVKTFDNNIAFLTEAIQYFHESFRL